MSENPYEDIINLPHPMSRNHAPMPLQERAAQFAPFAALVGYDDAIRETARRTDDRRELDENEKALIDLELQFVAEHLAEEPELSLEYFVPDARKQGGSYATYTGKVKKIDAVERCICFSDGKRVKIDDVLSLQGGDIEIM